MKKKYFNFNCKQNAEDPSIISFLGSDPTVDRVGEIMTLDGWEIDNYVKNPVILFAHDYSLPPIGKAINVSQNEKGLSFDVQFVPKEIDPFAEKIKQLYLGGYMNAVSVGFIPKEYKNFPDGTLGITKKELLELSCVPVPCNPNALQNAFQKGIIDEGDMKRLKEMTLSEMSARMDDVEKRLSAIEGVVKAENVVANDSADVESAKEIKSIFDALMFPEDKADSSLSDSEIDMLKELTK